MKDHVIRNHLEAIDQASVESFVRDSWEAKPRPVQQEQCDFCHAKDFPNWDEFAVHVGAHLEDISRRVLYQYLPERLPGYLGLAGGKPQNGTPGEKLVDVEVHDGVQPCSHKLHAVLDTGSGLNYVTRGLVDDLQLSMLPLQQIFICIGMNDGNNKGLKVDEYVIPSWRVDGSQNSYFREEFLIVPELANGRQMLLGHDFIQRSKCYTFHLSCLIIHMQKQGSCLKS